LAICKPTIRRVAKKDSYLLGFAGNEIDPKNGLIYVACVADKLAKGAYYVPHGSFAARPDCIYLKTPSGYEPRKGARFHPGGEELTHDLGSGPDFKNANVLLSTDFRYFGKDRVAIDSGPYRALATFVHSIGVGHRVNFSPTLANSIVQFVNHVFTLKQPKTPVPTHRTETRCDRDDTYEHVSCRRRD
jgi:hypothetical protein